MAQHPSESRELIARRSPRALKQRRCARLGLHPRPWHRILHCRQLDARLGLLLTRAAMLDPNAHPSLGQGYVDPMATRAVGSFAWWCRSILDACEDDYPLGDRLQEDQIHPFVGFALHRIGEIVPGLAEDPVRVFPLMVG